MKSPNKGGKEYSILPIFRDTNSGIFSRFCEEARNIPSCNFPETQTAEFSPNSVKRRAFFLQTLTLTIIFRRRVIFPQIFTLLGVMKNYNSRQAIFRQKKYTSRNKFK